MVGGEKKEEDRESYHLRDSTVQKLLHAGAAARDDDMRVVCDQDSNLDAAHCFDLNYVQAVSQSIRPQHAVHQA